MFESSTAFFKVTQMSQNQKRWIRFSKLF